MSMLSRFILALPAAGLLAVVTACGNGSEPAERPRPVMVVQPTPAAAAFEAYSGEVRARHEPQLAFRIGGKIARRHVDVGDPVRAGQLLAELDPDDLRLQMEAVKAQLTAAEADLALAESELERHRALLDRQLISASLLDARETAQRAAEAQVRQVRAQLEATRNQVGYARLTAPSSGLIAQRLAEAGQVVAAGQPVFVLAAAGEREVAIALPEQRIDRFAVGQAVLVELWSRPGERIPGTLRELARSADPASRTFAARVAFEASADGTELGQSARVYAARNGAPALALPLTAVSADDGQSFVWVVDPAEQRLRKTLVQTGPYRQDSVPVLDGVSAGQWVVAAGVHLLRDGQRVLAVDRDNRPVKLTPPEAAAATP